MKNEHKIYSKLISSIIILVIIATLFSACSRVPPRWVARDEPVPAQIQVNTRVVAVSSARGDCGTVSFALMDDGSLWSWGTSRHLLGDSARWRLLRNRVRARFRPEKIMEDVMYISGSGAWSNGHVFAIQTDGTLWAWGFNLFGRLGDGTEENRGTPVVPRHAEIGMNDNQKVS